MLLAGHAHANGYRVAVVRFPLIRPAVPIPKKSGGLYCRRRQGGRVLLDCLICLPLRCMVEFDPGEDGTEIMRLLHAKEIRAAAGAPWRLRWRQR